MLGTAQFGLRYGIANSGGQVSSEVASAMLNFAADNGVAKLDTAIAYGDAETRLGRIGVHRFEVVTKLPPVPRNFSDVAAWVNGQIEGSCARLKSQRIHAVLLHRPLQLLESVGIDLYRALSSLKARGIVAKIGISIYDPEELDLLDGRFHFDLVQAPFNLVDRRLMTSGWMARLKDAGTEVHCRSAFLQGLLLMQIEKRPRRFAPWSYQWQLWHNWLRERNVGALQACLSFLLTNSEIDGVVVGADNVRQLQQIINATACMSGEDWPEIAIDDVRLVNPACWATL